jgi:hypothetical protein
MVGLRKGIVARGFIVPALALWGCGSHLSSPLKPDAQADGGTDGPDASDGGAVDVLQTGGTDGPGASDGGAVDVAGTDGGKQDAPAVCGSPLGFPSNSQPPSMCPGVVLKTAKIPFAPTDSRWSTLYQGCLDNYGSLIYPDDCRKLCTVLATASAALRYNQGITWCSLDCSQPGTPVLSVEYSDTICEPMPFDSGPSTQPRPDAGLDGALVDGIDGARVTGSDAAPDTKTGLEPSDGGSPPHVALRNVYAYGNCMPMIQPDPIIAIWTVDITGARREAAQLTKATIAVSKGTSIVQDFTVDNPIIPLVGGAGNADQRKPLASVSPNQACSTMCSGATYQLDLVFEIDGQSISVSKPGDFSCAY